MTEKDGVRSIWGRNFQLQACPVCGNQFAPEYQLEWMAREDRRIPRLPARLSELPEIITNPHLKREKSEASSYGFCLLDCLLMGASPLRSSQ